MIVVLMATCFLAGRQYQAVAAAPAHSAQLARLVTALAGGDNSGQPSGRDDVSMRPLETFQEVLNHLRGQYYSPIKSESKLTYGAIHGMLSALRDEPYNDRYSRFMEPDDYRSFLDENEGHFGGIGAEIGVREVAVSEKLAGSLPAGIRCPVCGADVTRPVQSQIVVVAPFPDSPAERAGLRPGDHILKVADVPTAALGLTETVRRIKGRPGTTVDLTIEHKGSDKPVTVQVVRAVIQVHSVESKMLADGIGYLKITTFNDTTPTLTRKALRDLRASGMRALLLDLRNNTGGELDSCIQTASQFIGQGPVVYIQERGEERKPRNAANGSKRLDLPAVVLINEGSASAAEILAGAIQDDKLATLMGVKTFGKGLVQTVFPLEGGGALALTTARYLTPKLRDIDRKGISPDIEVKQPESSAAAGRPAEPIRFLTPQDAQASAAIKYLRDELRERTRASALPLAVPS
jgi:carboxyl-terminal processing protease